MLCLPVTPDVPIELSDNARTITLTSERLSGSPGYGHILRLTFPRLGPGDRLEARSPYRMEWKSLKPKDCRFEFLPFHASGLQSRMLWQFRDGDEVRLSFADGRYYLICRTRKDGRSRGLIGVALDVPNDCMVDRVPVSKQVQA